MSPLTSSGAPASSLPDRVRCPRCSALAAAGAAWCGQCLYDLRAPEPMLPPDPTPVADAEPTPRTADALAGAPAAAPQSAGRHRRADAGTAPEPLSSDSNGPESGLPGRAEDDTAALAQRTLETLLAVDPAASGSVPGGGWVERLAEPGARLGVMIGGTLAVTAAVFALFALAGVLLG